MNTPTKTMATAVKVARQISILGRQWSAKDHDAAFVIGLFSAAIVFARVIRGDPHNKKDTEYFARLNAAAEMLANELERIYERENESG